MGRQGIERRDGVGPLLFAVGESDSNMPGDIRRHLGLASVEPPYCTDHTSTILV